MTEIETTRRSLLDVVWGVVLVVLGLIVLAYAAIVTAVSIVLLGWLTLFAGLLAIAAALFRIGRGGFWPAAVSGGLLAVLGLVFLRDPGAAALTLTLLAGAFFLASGVVRLVAAVENDAYRWPLVFGGIAGVVLGLLVIFNVFAASFTLLGVLLGLDLVADGITLLLVGRVHSRSR